MNLLNLLKTSLKKPNLKRKTRWILSRISRNLVKFLVFLKSQKKNLFLANFSSYHSAMSMNRAKELSREILNLEKLGEFFKDLGEIERDYSRKLNNLRKYNSNFQDLLEFCLEKSSNSSEFCLEIQEILKSINSTLDRKDHSKKNINTWLQKIDSEKDKFNSNVGKGKENFDKSCDSVQLLQLKLGKVPLPKLQKLKKELNSKIIDMNNDKNDYITMIKGVNSVNQEFNENFRPQILENIHDSTETVVNAIIKSCKAFQEKQAKNYSENLENLDKFKRNLENFDTKKYLQELRQEEPVQEIQQYEFISSGLWKDTNEYVLDENSKVYMWNSKEKLDKRIQKIQEELEILENGIQGLNSLKLAYSKDDKNKDDLDVVDENILDSKRSKLLLMLNLSYYSRQLDEISPYVQGNFFNV